MSRDEKVVSTELRVHAGHALNFVESFVLKSSLVLLFQSLTLHYLWKSTYENPYLTKAISKS